MGKFAMRLVLIACCCAAQSCSRPPGKVRDAGIDRGGTGGSIATGGTGGSDDAGTGGMGGAAGTGGAGAVGGAGGIGAVGGSVGGSSGGAGRGGTGGTGGTSDVGDAGATDVHPCGAAVLADSICDFSNEQGRHGWSYGYIEPQNANTFVPMTEYSSVDERWYADSDKYWTHIGATAAHPNGITTSGTRIAVNQWAVRRWQSTVSGTINVAITLFKADTTAGQNGIIAWVIVDGVVLWSHQLPASDGVGVQTTVPATVTVGSTIDLALDPFEGKDLNDETYFSATITQ